MPTIAAIIVAAGRGHRAGDGLPKQYRQVGAGTVLKHTLNIFAQHPDINEINCVIDPGDLALYMGSAGGLDLLPPAHGGVTRQQSVLNGLLALEGAPPDIVLIHDAARAFVSAEILTRVIDKVVATGGGAIPGLAITDTLKRAKADGARSIAETVPRGGLYRAQTPQGFPFPAILAAHRAVEGRSLGDDAAVAEAVGLPVHLVAGSEDNIKLTTAEDFAMAERRYGTEVGTRTGMGFDVHRFEAGDHVRLCGVDIPHSHALQGHSDADVALHALTDAILGTIAAGDIGDHFPPGVAEWKDAPSDIFLRKAVDLVAEAGGEIENVDLTIICEAPRIGPHRASMCAKIAEITGLAPTRVSVKATTSEKLGFTGRGEGIAAQAIASVRL